MADPKEAACEKSRREISEKIHQWVLSVCDETGLQIQAIERNLAGSPLSHTIVNHEIHLGFEVSSPDPSSTKSSFLGIRVRQRDFEPFVTVWSTKTMMRDFRATDQIEQLLEEIASVLHGTP